MQYAVEIIRNTPGCLSADCWLADNDAVVSSAQWDSADARAASFASARQAGADFDFDERECRPRQVFQLRAP